MSLPRPQAVDQTVLRILGSQALLLRQCGLL